MLEGGWKEVRLTLEIRSDDILLSDKRSGSGDSTDNPEAQKHRKGVSSSSTATVSDPGSSEASDTSASSTSDTSISSTDAEEEESVL